jgi:hypothetical protein
MRRSSRMQVDHLIPPVIRLTLSDPWGTVERIALELMECTSEQRDDFVRKCGRIWKTIAHSNGCSEMVAADFALQMQRLIGEVVSEIEASSGGKVGTDEAKSMVDGGTGRTSNTLRGIVTVTSSGRLSGGGRDWRHEDAPRPPLPPSVSRRDH